MFLFLDDVRTAPAGSVCCRDAKTARKLLMAGDVEMISFDHDLGSKLTGYDVARFIESEVHAGRMQVPAWTVHSANPVGRANIEAAMVSAERFEAESVSVSEVGKGMKR